MYLFIKLEMGESYLVFFFQAEDGIRDGRVTGVQTCALPIFPGHRPQHAVKRAEGEDLRLPRPRLIPGRPDRDLDHVFMHVDPRHALIHHFHAATSCSGIPPPDNGHGTPPARTPASTG